MYWDTGDTGRHHVNLHIGAFDVSATDHYLRNETLCLSEKTARDGLGMEEDGEGGGGVEISVVSQQVGCHFGICATSFR